MDNILAGKIISSQSPDLKDRKKILVVDDEYLIRYSLQNQLEDDGFKVFTAESGAQALRDVKKNNPDFILLDIRLPDSDGLTLLKKIKHMQPAATVIMITASPDIQTSVEAMKSGAMDFLEKPVNMEKLKVLLHPEREEATAARKLDHHAGFIFQSPVMKEIYRVTERLANNVDVPVLVLGESGTGKTFLCKSIHERSSRRQKLFVEIGCSMIPEHLIESELFGYEKGAFTDAKTAKKGLVEVAEGGTLFLDEIGDMPYPMQSKLLSLIEERRFRRIGGLQSVDADIRIIAATNRNLADLVRAGKFRLDLYYRLNVVTVEMPPLRARQEDIPLLVSHYLGRYSKKYGLGEREMTGEALRIVSQYSWPGNIRELKNLIEKLVILAKNNTIDVDDLKSAFPLQGQGEHKQAGNLVPDPGAAANPGQEKDLCLRANEAEYIRTALKAAGGNQRKAAKLLDVTRDTLRYRLKKLGIEWSNYNG